jgi:uncharacterized membrane protein YkvA (DUF1232 family)
MSEQRKAVAAASQVGGLAQLVRTLRLVWRLFKDPRVPFLTKLIIPFTIVYVVSPIDLIPDPILGLGQLDDIGAIVVGLTMFIEFCPHDLVEEHRHAIAAKEAKKPSSDEDIIEGTYREVSNDDSPTNH